jgi:CRP-like cAMP-binding protein
MAAPQSRIDRSDPAPAPWHLPPLDTFGPELRAAARRLRKPAGATIFLTGQRPTRLFFVASGEAVMSRTDRHGRSLVLQRASDGFLAEASLSSARYHCDAHSRTATELVAFPVDLLRRAIDRDAAIRWAWIAMLAGEIRRQRANAERLALKSVRERLLHRLLTEGEDGRFALRTTRKELAAELGVTHEALYRTIATLVRTGELVDDGTSLTLR